MGWKAIAITRTMATSTASGRSCGRVTMAPDAKWIRTRNVAAEAAMARRYAKPLRITSLVFMSRYRMIAWAMTAIIGMLNSGPYRLNREERITMGMRRLVMVAPRRGRDTPRNTYLTCRRSMPERLKSFL